MEPDAAFVSQRESCNVTQECKDQRCKKAKTWWNWNIHCQATKKGEIKKMQGEGALLAAFMRFAPKCGHRGQWLSRLVQIWAAASDAAWSSSSRWMTFATMVRRWPFFLHAMLSCQKRTQRCTYHSELCLTACLQLHQWANIQSRTSIIQANLLTKGVPKPRCCPHIFKGECKKCFQTFLWVFLP